MKASKSLWSVLVSWFLLSSNQDESKNTIEIEEKFLDSTPPSSNLSDNPSKITEFAFSFCSQNYFTKLTQKPFYLKPCSFYNCMDLHDFVIFPTNSKMEYSCPKLILEKLDPVVSNLRVFHISNPYLFHFLIV